MFDTFKGEISTMAKLHKSFGNTMVAMRPDEVEDGYGDAAGGDAADGDAADDEEEVAPTKKRKKRKKNKIGNEA